MKYALVIIFQLLALGPAFSAECLKSGDVVSGTLDRAEGGIGDTSHYVVEVLSLPQPRCFVADDGKPSGAVDEVEVVLGDGDKGYPDALLNALIGNDVEVTLGGESEPRMREVGVFASISSVTVSHAGCDVKANPGPKTPVKYGAKITAAKRVNFHAAPAEGCKSSIFVVNKDPVEVLAETDKYAFVRYVSKQKISYYGWVPKNAVARN